jgi:hypothetical protein
LLPYISKVAALAPEVSIVISTNATNARRKSGRGLSFLWELIARYVERRRNARDAMSGNYAPPDRNPSTGEPPTGEALDRIS